MNTRTSILLGISAISFTFAGCSTPMSGPTDSDLRQSIVDSTRRELTQAERSPASRTPDSVPDPLNFSPERRRELNQISGVEAYGVLEPPLGLNLFGEETATVALSLQQAVARTVAHNLSVQVARLEAAASQTDIIAAEALFDWVFFADASLTITDQQAFVPVINGVPIGSAVNRNQVFSFDAGLRKPLITGGQLQITQTYDIFNNKSPDRDVFPDPAHTAGLDIALFQPLLRGFGSDVALSEVRLARNFERASLEQLRADLIEVVTQTEQAYWSLLQAYRTVQITQRLIERGIETRDVLQGRIEFDVRPAEFSDAVAQVESRRATLIRAINDLRTRSDELKVLLNDPAFPVGGEEVFIPVDQPTETAVSVSLLDSIQTAFASRPEIQQAILSIDDASIRETVADNFRLPRLDLQLAATLNGLGDTTSRAFDQLGDATYVDYLAGIAFEQPIGNREAEARFRRARLERLSSVVTYRATAQQVVADVKSALRSLVTNFQLIQQTRIARLAAAENLRTLEVEERNIRGLTPEFLNLKFQRQDALAIAELNEIQALVDYNVSIADLYAAIGSTLPRNRIRFVVPELGEPIGAIERANAAPQR